jgi:hypothetical protein
LTADDLYRFLSGQRLAVVSSIGPDGAPQSAVVGIGVTPDLKVVFDTLKETRKCRNLLARSACSLVIGWDNEITAQYQGFAVNRRKHEEGAWKDAYFKAWPDGRERLSWPGITYFVVLPRWIRYSDFNQRPPSIIEFTF